MTTIELKTAPDISRIIRAAYPDYRKHKAFLSAFSGSENINSYWDGGSRDTYVVVDLATLRTHALPTATHPYFDIAGRGLANSSDKHVEIDHVGNVTLKHLPEGFALVKGGTFCGKPATAHVIVPPANMARLIEGGAR